MCAGRALGWHHDFGALGADCAHALATPHAVTAAYSIYGVTAPGPGCYTYTLTVAPEVPAMHVRMWLGYSVPACLGSCFFPSESSLTLADGGLVNRVKQGTTITMPAASVFYLLINNVLAPATTLIGTLDFALCASATASATVTPMPTPSLTPVPTYGEVSLALGANTTGALPTVAQYRYYRAVVPAAGTYRAEVWFESVGGSNAVEVAMGFAVPSCVDCPFNATGSAFFGFDGYHLAAMYMPQHNASSGIVVRVRRARGIPTYTLRTVYMGPGDTTTVGPSVQPSPTATMAPSVSSSRLPSPSATPGVLTGSLMWGQRIPLGECTSADAQLCTRRRRRRKRRGRKRRRHIQSPAARPLALRRGNELFAPGHCGACAKHQPVHGVVCARGWPV